MNNFLEKKYSQLTLVLCCGAVLVMTVIFRTSISEANLRQEIVDLKQALRNELAIRTIEPILWDLGTFRGKSRAHDLCAKGATGELIPTRQGWGKLDCVDPDGNDFRLIGYWPDGKTLSARATVPFGRVGALAEYQRDPNKPDFAEWYIYKNDGTEE